MSVEIEVFLFCTWDSRLYQGYVLEMLACSDMLNKDVK